jgi:hypothetical protein
LLHVNLALLTVSNKLSKLLQSKNMNIITAMSLISATKLSISELDGDESFAELWKASVLFCEQHEIDVPLLGTQYTPMGRIRRNLKVETNEEHFRDILNQIIAESNKEMNSRFSETSSELMLSAAVLDPRNNFADWNKETSTKRLLKFASFYPSDFTTQELASLPVEVDLFIKDFKFANTLESLNLESLEDLSVWMVKTERTKTYGVLYRLVVLVLTLPVTSATGERSFSAMKIVKNRLRSKMGEDFLRALMLLGIEKELADLVTNDDIIRLYHASGPRRGNAL